MCETFSLSFFNLQVQLCVLQLRLCNPIANHMTICVQLDKKQPFSGYFFVHWLCSQFSLSGKKREERAASIKVAFCKPNTRCKHFSLSASASCARESGREGAWQWQYALPLVGKMARSKRDRKKEGSERGEVRGEYSVCLCVRHMFPHVYQTTLRRGTGQTRQNNTRHMRSRFTLHARCAHQMSEKSFSASVGYKYKCLKRCDSFT